MRRFLTPTCILCASMAHSDGMRLQFADGNPYDLFYIINLGCPIEDATLHIDLRTSLAGVLIDTEYGGPGTRDPMDVRLMQGTATIAPVTDGDQILSIGIDYIGQNGALEIGLDLDDSQGAGMSAGVEVYGGEIKGASVTLTTGTQSATGAFDPTGIAVVPTEGLVTNCLTS